MNHFLTAAGAAGMSSSIIMLVAMLAMRLAVMHNLYFYNKLMERIRNALDTGCFEAFRREYSEKLARRI